MNHQTEDKQSTRAIDIRLKAAFVAVLMNIVLTGFKFLAYRYSGSLAVFSEAWHSFADIATSTLVLVAVFRTCRKKGASELQGEDRKDKPTHSKIEMAVSIGIGICLASLAVSLATGIILSEPREVENALKTGLLFMAFSIGSFFIYRFETHIGKAEQSVGLVSDGLHARSDMVASLLTGFSLILYQMGTDIDRWMALLISLFIFSYALEIFINTYSYAKGRQPDTHFHHRSHWLIHSFLDPVVLKRGCQAVYESLNRKVLPISWFHIPLKRLISGLAVGFILGYLSTCFFTVKPHEEAVIERFGKPLHYMESSIGPGLQFKLPWPIDRVHIVNTHQMKTINIGNVTQDPTIPLIWTVDHGTDEAFLSGDNNFFYPYMVLHYRIKDIWMYLFRNSDPIAIIEAVSYRVATDIFARNTFYDISAMNRRFLESQMAEKIQVLLDKMGLGVDLLSVNFKDIHPPILVADAFEAVVAGFQEKQERINNALEYRNRILPDAKGEAIRQVLQAEGYIVDRKKRAEGDSIRLMRSMPKSDAEKRIATSRLYFDTIVDILQAKRKIIVDPKAGKPSLWMDFATLPSMPYEGEKQP